MGLLFLKLFLRRLFDLFVTGNDLCNFGGANSVC
jgi:hypothetical protein